MGAILVAARDPRRVVRLIRSIDASTAIEVVRSRDAADRALAGRKDWLAVFASADLPGDRDRLRPLFEHVAQLVPTTPRALLCARATPRLRDIAASHGGVVMEAPLVRSEIEQFLRRSSAQPALEVEELLRREVEAAVEAAARRLRIVRAPRRRAILVRLALGRSRSQICHELGMRPATLKSQVRRMLQTTDARTVAQLVAGVLGPALCAKRPPQLTV